MADIKLTDDGDIDISTGDLVVIDGLDAIAQHLKIRLGMVRGDYFLDQRVGIPYYEQVLVKNPQAPVVRQLMRDVVLGTPGIASIGDLLLEYDAAARSLSVSFSAVADTGETLTFDEVLIL